MSGISINLNFVSKLLVKWAGDLTLVVYGEGWETGGLFQGLRYWGWRFRVRAVLISRTRLSLSLEQAVRGDARTYLFSLAFQVFPKCQHIVLKGLQGGGGGGGGLVFQCTQGGSTIKRIFHLITSKVWTWQWLFNQLVEASATGEFNLLNEPLLIEWHLTGNAPGLISENELK